MGVCLGRGEEEEEEEEGGEGGSSVQSIRLPSIYFVVAQKSRKRKREKKSQ